MNQQALHEFRRLTGQPLAEAAGGPTLNSIVLGVLRDKMAHMDWADEIRSLPQGATFSGRYRRPSLNPETAVWDYSLTLDASGLSGKMRGENFKALTGAIPKFKMPLADVLRLTADDLLGEVVQWLYATAWKELNARKTARAQEKL